MAPRSSRIRPPVRRSPISAAGSSPWAGVRRIDIEISQGELIGRPSLLHLEVNTDKEVFVGGDVIEIGSGILNL